MPVGVLVVLMVQGLAVIGVGVDVAEQLLRGGSGGYAVPGHFVGAGPAHYLDDAGISGFAQVVLADQPGERRGFGILSEEGRRGEVVDAAVRQAALAEQFQVTVPDIGVVFGGVRLFRIAVVAVMGFVVDDDDRLRVVAENPLWRGLPRQKRRERPLPGFCLFGHGSLYLGGDSTCLTAIAVARLHKGLNGLSSLCRQWI